MMDTDNRRGVLVAAMAYSLVRLDVTEQEWDDLFCDPKRLEREVLDSSLVVDKVLARPEHNAVMLVSLAREIFGDEAADQLAGVVGLNPGKGQVQ